MMKLRKTRETALKALEGLGKKKKANEDDGDVTIIEPDGGGLKNRCTDYLERS